MDNKILAKLNTIIDTYNKKTTKHSQKYYEYHKQLLKKGFVEIGRTDNDASRSMGSSFKDYIEYDYNGIRVIATQVINSNTGDPISYTLKLKNTNENMNIKIKLKQIIKEEIRKILNESSTYNIGDFAIDKYVHFKDGEVWKVVKSGLRSTSNKKQNDEVTLKPVNALAKKNNTSLSIDFKLKYLNDNVTKISNTHK